MELPNGLMPTYENFLNELQSHDEQDHKPNASFRSEDYRDKDDLMHAAAIIDSIIRVISDGEQLDPEQSELINNVFNQLQSLKRSIEGREELKAAEMKKLDDERTFGS